MLTYFLEMGQKGFNSFNAGMLNTIMPVVREAEYNARYTLAAGGGEIRPSHNRP